MAAARSVVRKLAKAYTPAELLEVAYTLYERFRPAVPEGKWG